MTEASTGVEEAAAGSLGDGLGACLDALERAIGAAGELGIATDRAASVLETSRARLGIAPDAYVLALAGGTGVGKSTLLNAIAGSTVSPAGVRRPTTDRPVAWVARGAVAGLRPLLERLGVDDVRAHDADGNREVAILDLPDLDSIEASHRAVVDEILPRVDAVAWVVDPEKYADAAFHLGYLTPIGERFARQAIVVNKVDLLDGSEADAVRADVARRLDVAGLADVRVVLTSALRDGSGSNGLEELHDWLAEGAEAKKVIGDRIRADVRAASRDLARRAGVAAGGGRPEPLLARSGRANVQGSIEREVVRLLDLPGFRRQAVAATRQAARASGTGPAGLITSRLYRWTGLSAAGADPGGHLRRWRRRGSLAAVVGSVAAIPGPVLATLPAEARPAVAAAVAPALAARQADGAIDDVVASLGELVPPRSRLWPLLGVAQAVVAVDLLVAALWLVTLWLSHAGAGSVDLPIVGPVPWPFAMIVGGLVAGFLLARLLAFHAGWLGGRWADRLAGDVSREVAERVGAAVLQPLDAIDGARRLLSEAAGTIEGCSGVREAP